MEAMSLICQQCGGDIILEADGCRGCCAACDTAFFFSEQKSPEKINLLNQANLLRSQLNFDAALSIYSSLLNIDQTDSEIYWGIVLCTYGIVYSFNHATHKITPNIYKSNVETSIFYDKNYLKAVTLASPPQKQIYRTEAQLIDSLLTADRMAREGNHIITEGGSYDANNNAGENAEGQKSYRIRGDYSKERVTRELQILARERSHYMHAYERATASINSDRVAARRAIEQRKQYEQEHERLEKILATPNFYAKKRRKEVNHQIWLRLLFSVFLVIFAPPLVERLGVGEGWQNVLAISAIILCGMAIIWYEQFVPIGQAKVEKKLKLDTEREFQLREKIIQCNIQITNINTKLEKTKAAEENAAKSLDDINSQILEYIELYDYAEKIFEKITASLSHKITTTISNNINSVTEELKSLMNQ